MDGGTRGSPTILRGHDNKGHNPYRRLSTSDSHEHHNLHLDYEPLFRLPLCHCLLLCLSHSHGYYCCWGTTASPTALVPPLHRSVLLGCPWIYRATAQSDSSRDCLCSLCHCWTAGSGGSAYASSPAPSLLLMDMELVLLIPERGTRYLEFPPTLQVHMHVHLQGGPTILRGQVPDSQSLIRLFPNYSNTRSRL